MGYTDHCIGYLPDPNAYKAGEYSAITVPKIIDFPPFTPDVRAGVGRRLDRDAQQARRLI